MCFVQRRGPPNNSLFSLNILKGSSFCGQRTASQHVMVSKFLNSHPIQIHQLKSTTSNKHLWILCGITMAPNKRTARLNRQRRASERASDSAKVGETKVSALSVQGWHFLGSREKQVLETPSAHRLPQHLKNGSKHRPTNALMLPLWFKPMDGKANLQKHHGTCWRWKNPSMSQRFTSEILSAEEDELGDVNQGPCLSAGISKSSSGQSRRLFHDLQKLRCLISNLPGQTPTP